MFFGLDKNNELWIYRTALKSDFPGPMYPIGFHLIQKVETYIEAEDELDIVMAEQGIHMTTPDEANSTGDSCIDIFAPVSQYKYLDGYLSELPFTHFNKKPASTAVKVSKLSLIAASTAVLVQEKIQHEINGHGHGHGHLHGNDYDIEVVDMDEQNDLKQDDEKDDTPVFSSFFGEFFPIPTKIQTGDYFSKLARDRLIGKKIRATAEDLDFTKAAIDKIKKEAVDLVLAQVAAKEKRRLKAEERKKQKEDDAAAVALLKLQAMQGFVPASESTISPLASVDQPFGFPDVSEKLPEEEPAIESLPVVSNNNATIDTPKDERILYAAANSDATNNEKVDIDIEIQEMLPSTVSDTPQEEGTDSKSSNIVSDSVSHALDAPDSVFHGITLIGDSVSEPN
eukprot:gene32680-42323_t